MGGSFGVMFMLVSVVINNFKAAWSLRSPGKTQAKLLVNPDAVLAANAQFA
jgi:hypothetical protein